MSPDQHDLPLPRPELPRVWTQPPGGTVLVLAPHADDETCGCGGAIALHAAGNDKVFVDILTAGTTGDPDGHFPDLASLRRKEAEEAVAQLGGTQVSFWGLPDNFEITQKDIENTADRIVTRIEEVEADLLYYPWEGESHADHRAVALASGLALAKVKRKVRGLAYEVWNPLPAIVILDISGVRQVKEAALSLYTSQLYYTDYQHHIFGLNAHRGIFLEKRAGFGEAYLPAAGFFEAGREDA